MIVILDLGVLHTLVNTSVDETTLELAAEARNKGMPTANDNSFDADIIICAKARPAHGEETSPSFLAQ